MKKILTFITMAYGLNSHAQSFTEHIDSFRQHYIQDLLAEPRKPVKDSEVKYLQFYPADINYKVKVRFTSIKDSTGFIMETHSGVIRKYFKYGKLNFKLKNKPQQLFVYQSEKLLKDSNYKDYLFLPFNDLTNNRSTYGGGRYIDLKITDIKNGQFILDFNTCYNPYCAFATGFNCAISPQENRMKISVEAGEKMFLKLME
jgi:uncharacterized protein